MLYSLMMARNAIKPTKDAQIKPGKLLRFHLALQHWYQAHGRHDLPWRQTRDPYPIWVSEIMLQQTQVATVRDRYYHNFLQRFPTLEALAAAPREAVMKAWEGLGYYRRAAHLHEAAKRVSDFRFQVPEILTEAWNPEPDTLLTLPGIGRNTAHAILAFAYHQPMVVMEANVKRIVARIFALTQPKEAELWAGAEILMGLPMRLSKPSSRSTRAQGGRVAALRNRTEHGRDKEIGQRNAWMNCFHYNQAMMDLGAMICTPKAPRCNACPASGICKGQSDPTHYPQAKAKKKIPIRHVVILVREDAKGRLYLEHRETALLGGMYGFPQLAASHNGGKKIGTLTHIYSHFRLEATVRLECTRTGNSRSWYNREALARLPLSSLDRNVLKLLQRRKDS